jgi:hypothetical protein
MELKVDDPDWNIDLKIQLSLISNAMNQWRADVTRDNPYGRNWDIFMFGHWMEVPPSLILLTVLRGATTRAKNHTSFTPIPLSSL